LALVNRLQKRTVLTTLVKTERW